MRALITGITGFVGSHLAEYTLENHTEVEVAGFVRWRSPKVDIEGVLDRVALYYGNLLDFCSVRSMLAEYKPDVIFHLAAQSYMDFSFRRYELYPQTETYFLRAVSLPDWTAPTGKPHWYYKQAS